jgi:hypothetical protein
MKKKITHDGMKFGRLTVVSAGGKGCNKSVCLCICGQKKAYYNGNLTSGRTQSCGCLWLEVIKNQKRAIKHNMSNSQEYKIYSGMKMRCSNKKHKEYKRYGGRGIKVCERWETSFENFFTDMGERPKGMSLDRIDVNGNYCKENCRWATSYEQNNNKRNNVRITFNGKTMTAGQWSNELGFKKSVLTERIKRGWSIERAISEPLMRNGLR